MDKSDGNITQPLPGLSIVLDDSTLASLAGAPQETVRRQGAAKVRQAIKEFMLSKHPPTSDDIVRLREGLSLLVYNSSVLGIGDRPLRDMLVFLVERCDEKLGLLLDFLPAVFKADQGSYTQQLVSCLEKKDPSIALLQCLSRLDGAKSRAFDMAVKALPTVGESDQPALVGLLLRIVTTEKEATVSLHLLEVLPLRDLEVLIAVLESFPSSGESVLATAVLKRVKEQQEDEEFSTSKCCMFLLTILLFLSNNSAYEASTDSVIDVWMRKRTFPVSSMNALLDRFHPTCSLYSLLALSLLRLAIVLLLNTSHEEVQPTDAQFVEALVVRLHQNLNECHQEELVQSLLNLKEESYSLSTSTRKRKRRVVDSSLIRFSIFRILRTIAETCPSSVARFHHVLVGQLTSNGGDETSMDISQRIEYVETICSILVSLLGSEQSGLDSQGLKDVLKKLLFGAHAARRAVGDCTPTFRGLILGEVIVGSGLLEQQDKTDVLNWVLQVVLPVTRRMIAPELGEPCLKFLTTWMAINDGNDSNEIFQKFKMILANTGLIQLLCQYKDRTKSKAILGYIKVDPGYFNGVENTRDMLFCVQYFLCRNDLRNPVRWDCSCRWVFKLVDTYLDIGRNTAQNGWASDGWLKSAIEIPPINLPSQSLPHESKEALEGLQNELNTFEVSPGCAQQLLIDTKELCQIFREVFAGGTIMEEILSSAVHFEAALLLAMSLSFAVIKNAFDHIPLEVLSDEQRAHQLRPLQYQLLKIYDLHSKSLLIIDILLAMQSLQRSKSRNKPESPQGLDENRVKSSAEVIRTNLGIPSLSEAINCIEKQHLHLFSETTFVNPAILWKCLEHEGEKTVHGIVDGLPDVIERVEEMVPPTTQISLDLQTRIADHLSLLLSTTKHIKIPRSSIQQCISSVDDLCKSLPKARSILAKCGYINGENPFLRPAVAYLRLLRLILIKPSIAQEDVETSERVNLEWCADCPCLKSGGTGPSTWADSLFMFFRSHLATTAYSATAHFILEILSVLGVNGDKRLLTDSSKLNWISLHTVYVESTEDRQCTDSLSFVQSEVMRMLSSKEVLPCTVGLRRVIEATVFKYAAKNPRQSRFSCQRQALFRHWVLMVRSAKLMRLFHSHLSSLIEEIRAMVRTLGRAINGSHFQEDETTEGNNSNLLHKPSLPFLDAATFPDYFETVAVLVVGSVAVAERESDDTKSPYNQCKNLACMFRQMMDLFRAGFHLLPGRMTSFIFNVFKEMMSATASQLQRCSEWRSTQPLLSVAERKAKNYDPGAISHFQELLDLVSENVIGSGVALVNFCLECNGSLKFPFKRTGLRQAIAKAKEQVEEIAILHNLPVPSFTLPPTDEGTRAAQPTTPVKGFPTLLGGDMDAEESESDQDELDSSGDRGQEERKKPTDSESEDDGEDSFGVAGGWGDDSEGDEYDPLESYGLQTSGFLKTE